MLPDSVINLRLLLIGTFPEGLIGGLGLNVLVAVVSFIASFSLGHVLAIGRLSRIKTLRWACITYVELVRSVPLLIVLFWFYFSIPILLHTTPSPILTALIALSAYASAYQAEYIRAGIKAVPIGEIEAARSLGLSSLQRWRRVVLPQAHRKMLPTYASYFTSMFKDSSILYFLGLVELMQTGLIVAERHPNQMLQAYLTVGSLFFIVCWTASRFGKYLEWRLAPKQPAGREPEPAGPPSPFSPRPLKEEQHAHA